MFSLHGVPATAFHNPPSDSRIRLNAAPLDGIPDHRQEGGCKAPRSDDWGVCSHKPQGGTSEGNAADDALMVDRGSSFLVDW